MLLPAAWTQAPAWHTMARREDRWYVDWNGVTHGYETAAVLPAGLAFATDSAALGARLADALTALQGARMVLPALLALALVLLITVIVQRWRLRALRGERQAVIAQGRRLLGHDVSSPLDVLAEAEPLLTGARQIMARHDALAARTARMAPAAAPAMADAAGVDAADAALADLAPPVLAAAVAAAAARLQGLASHTDAAVFERVIGLGGALAALRDGLETLPRAADPQAIATVLRHGLEEAGWGHRILRAEAVLRAFAPAGSDWARLATDLALLTATTAAVLRADGVAILAPPLLAPARRHDEIAGHGIGDLQRIGFVRTAVRTALDPLAEPAAMVVDCLRHGLRVAATPTTPARDNPPIVVLYDPMVWR